MATSSKTIEKVVSPIAEKNMRRAAHYVLMELRKNEEKKHEDLLTLLRSKQPQIADQAERA